MKAIIRIFLLLLSMALVIGCGSSRHATKGQVPRLYGLWEVKAIHNSDEPGYSVTPPGMFKMIFPDGHFMNFMSTKEGAIITVNGTYRLEGDLYTEEIVHSFNKSQEGKQNPLQLKLSQQHFMYLRWFQPIDEFGVIRNRWIEEIWQRIRIEDLEVSNVDLLQELRSLPVNEEVIEKMVE